MPAPGELPPARYFAWLYSPPAQRSLLEALFGIEREIAASLRPGLDHHVAHSRLQWWREECERCANGRAVHPLTRELVAVFNASPDQSPSQHEPPEQSLSQHGAPGQPLPQLAQITGLVDTAIWDLARATFETHRELIAYCERWAAAVIEPVVAFAHCAPLPWRSVGAGLRELTFLNELASDAHAGHLRIPLDELDRIGAEPNDLAKPPWPPQIVELLRTRHETLRTQIATGTTSALSSIAGNAGGPDHAALRGLLVWVGLVLQTSRRAQRDLPDAPRPRRLDVLSDGWVAWRTARRAMSGRFE